MFAARSGLTECSRALAISHTTQAYSFTCLVDAASWSRAFDDMLERGFGYLLRPIETA